MSKLKTSKNQVTLREIIEGAVGNCENDLELVDSTINLIKQKLAHLRRVIAIEINKNRQMDNGYISTESILDIFYIELDGVCEGLDYDKKSLKDLSRECSNEYDESPKTNEDRMDEMMRSMGFVKTVENGQIKYVSQVS